MMMMIFKSCPSGEVVKTQLLKSIFNADILSSSIVLVTPIRRIGLERKLSLGFHLS